MSLTNNEVKYANVSLVQAPNTPWTDLAYDKQVRLVKAKYYTKEQMRPLLMKDGSPANAFQQLVYIAQNIEKNEQKGIVRNYPKYIVDAAREALAAHRQNTYRKVEFV